MEQQPSDCFLNNILDLKQNIQASSSRQARETGTDGLGDGRVGPAEVRVEVVQRRADARERRERRDLRNAGIRVFRGPRPPAPAPLGERRRDSLVFVSTAINT